MAQTPEERRSKALIAMAAFRAAYPDKARERAAAYRAAHPEECRARVRAYREAHLEESRAANRKYRAEHKDAIYAQQREYRFRNKEKIAARRKANRNIIREKDRERRGLPKPNRPNPIFCECCGRRPSKGFPHLDHCHVSGAFRGWLCGTCNRGIGCLGDSVKGLMNAVRYLERAAKQEAPHEQ